jgi:hypothetical protein
MLELDLVERHARSFHRLDRRIEGAGVPGDRDRNVAQVGQGPHG